MPSRIDLNNTAMHSLMNLLKSPNDNTKLAALSLYIQLINGKSLNENK